MTSFYLIRHALNDFVGQRLAGWMPGIHINDEGRLQARRLAAKLAPVGITEIYSSPLERAQETAQPLAEAARLKVETRQSFVEIQTGEWAGKTFAELKEDPQWQAFNQFRSGARVPGGELMLETQTRMVAAMLELRGAHPNGKIAIVSHADPIRAALVFFLGMPLDFYQRIEVGPASYSIVTLEAWGPVVSAVNVIA
jgi:probable phosphomutase (TIGR03848 family)